jgi:hypothetical protein
VFGSALTAQALVHGADLGGPGGLGALLTVLAQEDRVQIPNRGLEGLLRLLGLSIGLVGQGEVMANQGALGIVGGKPADGLLEVTDRR